MARITQGPNSLSVADLIYQSLTIATIDGKPALAIVNPDGSPIVGSATGVSPYPTGATPVTNSSGNVAAAAANATLPAVSAKTNYLTGFEITGAGATVGSIIAVTVTGVIGGTMTYNLVVPTGATTAAGLAVGFTLPIPASAVNTAIAVNVPSFGAGNTNAATVAHGFVV